MDGVNKLTVLAGPTQGFGSNAAGSQTSNAGRQGGRRGLDWASIPEICVNLVSVATGKSLLASLATHLQTT